MEEEAWQEFQASAIVRDREAQDWDKKEKLMVGDPMLPHAPFPPENAQI